MAPNRLRPVLAVLLHCLMQPAMAGIYLVTETYDAVDAAPGDGLCADAGGRCTLRAAVQEGNAAAGGRIIVLPEGIYTLTIPGNAEHAAATGDLDLLAPVTILGQGPDRTIIDAGGVDRVFEAIFAGDVLIKDLTLQNGVAGANTPGFGTVRAGGAIATVGDTSTLTLRNVVLRDNRAESGGGLYNIFSTVEIHDSTLHDNVATVGSGGGIAEGLASFTRLYNVTLSGNRAAQNGGGMATSNNTALLHNVTITGNQADSDTNGSGDGGGVYQGITAPTAVNSIVAGNIDWGGEAPDCAGAITSNGYNLIGSEIGCAVAPAAGDLIGTAAAPIAAFVEALAPMGNGIPMHALAANSPALDAGHPALPGSGGDACQQRDARGANRTLAGRCDIGAYEHAVVGRTFTVDSLLDRIDANPGDGVCETAAGNRECTLRAAIQEANALDGRDVIDVPAGTVLLTLAGIGENAAATGDLDITEAVLIRGAGMGQTIVDANGLDRVFHLDTSGHVELRGMTLRNGAIAGDSGGGILLGNTGGLDLVDMEITGNSAQSGGGVYAALYSWMHDGMVNVVRSRITGNTATMYGGGLNNFTFRSSRIVDSVLSGNSAQVGGGLFNSLMSMVLVSRSTLSGNTAQTGGGIGMQFGNGVVTLENTTLSGNRATLAGGGAHLGANETFNAFSSTITTNRAAGMADGGGIQATGRVRLANSVLAGNSDDDGVAPDCGATISSLGFNFIGSDAGCTFAAGVGDRIGTALAPLDARLGALSAPAGMPPYYAPLADSPLFDAANPAEPGSGGASCPATDQHGVDRRLNTPCDIGAVERRVADLAVAASVVTTAVEPAGAVTYAVRVANVSADVAESVVLTLTPPVGSVFQSASGAPWDCAAAAGDVLCLGGDLPGGASSEVSLTLLAPADAGTHTAQLRVTSASWDPDDANDSVQTSYVSTARVLEPDEPEAAPADPAVTTGTVWYPPQGISVFPSLPTTDDALTASVDAPAAPDEAPAVADADADSEPPATVQRDTATPADRSDADSQARDIPQDSAGSAPSRGMATGIAGVRATAATGVTKGAVPAAVLLGDTDESSVASLEFWAEIAAMREQMAAAETTQDSGPQAVMLYTAKTMTVFLFAGATNWYLKGSSLLASLFSSLPLWARFDPLPILALSKRMKRRRQRDQAAAAMLESHYSLKLTRLLDGRDPPASAAPR